MALLDLFDFQLQGGDLPLLLLAHGFSFNPEVRPEILQESFQAGARAHDFRGS
jgi:hypothetical protein